MSRSKVDSRTLCLPRRGLLLAVGFLLLMAVPVASQPVPRRAYTTAEGLAHD